MPRRTLMLLLTLCLAGTIAAGGGTGEAVVASEACGDMPTADEVVLDSHDVCDVTLSVTAADGAPVIEATIRTHAAPTPGSRYVTEWTVGDCAFQLVHEDDLVGPAPLLRYDAQALVGCGPSTVDCTVASNGTHTPDVTFGCYRSYESGMVVAELEEPVVEGSSVTLRVRIEGDLAEFAELYAPGAVLQHTFTVVGPDMPYLTGPARLGLVVCDSNLGCSEVASDILTDDGTLTIPAT